MDALLPCMDCTIETSSWQDPGNYYMLHDDLWVSIVPDSKGLLCIRCAERRLGRGLRD
jgi:hypothetical protein